MDIAGAISAYAAHKAVKPRWRYDYVTDWWYRSTPTTFEFWDPKRWGPTVAFRPQKQGL